MFSSVVLSLSGCRHPILRISIEMAACLYFFLLSEQAAISIEIRSVKAHDRRDDDNKVRGGRANGTAGGACSGRRSSFFVLNSLSSVLGDGMYSTRGILLFLLN